MKYNPLLNDWAASLPGFAHAHPQSPESDVQGPLQVLYEIQEWFKNITGLPGVTTQPVAGAQGELVGLKLFKHIIVHEVNSQGMLYLFPNQHMEQILQPQLWRVLLIKMELSTFKRRRKD
jgi:glycine dehydrogenase